MARRWARRKRTGPPFFRDDPVERPIPKDGKTYIEFVCVAVLVEAGFVESVAGAGVIVAGALVDGMLILVSMELVIAGAGAGALVSMAGAVAVLVMVLSVLLLQPASAKGRLRVRRARREQFLRERFMMTPC
jgi:hypothetical protein